jgi:hypothetical protein
MTGEAEIVADEKLRRGYGVTNRTFCGRRAGSSRADAGDGGRRAAVPKYIEVATPLLNSD